MQWHYCLMALRSLPDLQIATEKVKRKKSPKSKVERYARRNQQVAPFSGKGIECELRLGIYCQGVLHSLPVMCQQSESSSPVEKTIGKRRAG